jgi:hypothetical protein
MKQGSLLALAGYLLVLCLPCSLLFGVNEKIGECLPTTIPGSISGCKKVSVCATLFMQAEAQAFRERDDYVLSFIA